MNRPPLPPPQVTAYGDSHAFVHGHPHPPPPWAYPPVSPSPAYSAPPYPTPGQPPPAGYGAPAFARRFRPAAGLAMAAVALAGVVALLEVIEAVVAWSVASTLREAAAAGVAPGEIFTGYDLVSVPLSAALLAAWIVTALWLVQARANAEVLNPWYRQRRSAVWAWLGWWVPVVLLWFPYQMVRDVRMAAVPWRFRRHTVVGWWWALWLFYLFTDPVGAQITQAMNPEAATIGLLGPAETFNAVVAVAALVLWCRIVLDATADQPLVACVRGV
jgi:hypothetical protein